jgi:hypothetical protein
LKHFIKVRDRDWVWWLTPVIPVTWEAEIRRFVVEGQPGEKVRETLSLPVIGCSGVGLSS